MLVTHLSNTPEILDHELFKKAAQQSVAPGSEASTVQLLDNSKDKENKLYFSEPYADFTVVSGLPFETDEPTPDRYAPVDHAKLDTVSIHYLAILCALGYVAGVDRVRGGRIIGDIMTRPGFENTVDSAFGSKHPFDAHRDVAWAEAAYRPDVFGLFCRRNASQTPTTFFHPDPTDLDASTRTTLGERRFRIVFNDQHDLLDPGLHATPILDERNEINYYGALKTLPISDKDTHARKALDTLHSLIKESESTSIALEPGQLLIALNHLHGRSSIPDWDSTGPHRRWLQRVFVYTDPAKIEVIKTLPQRIVRTDKSA